MSRAIGLVGLVLAVAAAPLLGCFCGPPATPPSTETCPAATGLVASDVRLFRHSGAELVDGSEAPVFFGPQGGMHWGFDLLVVAEGAGDCVDVELELRSGSPTGPSVGGFSGGVRSRIVEGGVRTSQIVVFPSGAASSSSTPVFATATAYGATRTVALCPTGSGCVALDAGPGPTPDAP